LSIICTKSIDFGIQLMLNRLILSNIRCKIGRHTIQLSYDD